MLKKMNKLLLCVKQRTLMLRMLPSLANNHRGYKRYCTGNGESESSGIIEKARSTAEEFARQAKEKTDSVKETAGEVWEDAKEAVAGEDPKSKDKYKEKVEKGKYDKIGEDL